MLNAQATTRYASIELVLGIHSKPYKMVVTPETIMQPIGNVKTLNTAATPKMMNIGIRYAVSNGRVPRMSRLQSGAEPMLAGGRMFVYVLFPQLLVSMLT